MRRRQIMTNTPLWLPELVLFNDFNGNWETYIDAIYQYFKDDLIDNQAYFKSLRVSIRKQPPYQEKHFSFWHVTSTGEKEEERIPDFRRCERIRWIRPIIENADDPAVKVWENQRRDGKRICLWLESQNYLVVLSPRQDYVLLLTAYTTDYERTRRKLWQEYNNYQSKKG
jgi:hypothetical protein